MTRTTGGAGNDEDAGNGDVWVCVCVCVCVYAYVCVCVYVYLCVDTCCAVGLPPNAWPSPNSCQPRGCGSVAPVAAVALLSLALHSMNDKHMHMHATLLASRVYLAGQYSRPRLSRFSFASRSFILGVALLGVYFCVMNAKAIRWEMCE